MKLSDYARQAGISYRTAWTWFKNGQLKGRQMPSGTMIVEVDEPPAAKAMTVAIYARVSATENRPNLDSQAERLMAYCAARGYQVQRVVKEVGSGVNDQRPKLLALLSDPSVSCIVVEHKDRLTRFGFEYIDCLLRGQGRQLEVVNLAENGREELLDDLTA